MSDAVFRAIARFGKRDANHDYEWLWGRDAIPEAIFGLCEYLALMANENSALLAMAAALPAGVWLARSFHQGSDAAQRPAYGLEVGTLSSARPLSTEQLLGFAWSATQGAWSPAAAPDGQVAIESPEAQEQTVTLHPETVLRARLGLPLTVAGTTPALAVLRRFPQRYQGVAIAPKLRGAAIPWCRELATLLCVHFGEPALDAAESALLEHTSRHPPTEEEWQALDLLSPSRMRAALLWAAGEGPFPGPAEGDLAAWLTAYRRRDHEGRRLLAALRADLGGAALSEELLARALPRLYPEARNALAAYEAGDGGELPAEVLSELAAAGLLGEGSPIPPRRWLPAAATGEAVRTAALDFLCARGVTGEAAAWLLDGAAGTPSLASALAVLTVARELDLEVPPALLWQLLDGLPSSAGLSELAPLAAVFGPRGPALLALLDEGTLPAAEALGLPDLLRGLAARWRLAGALDLPALLRDLLRDGRTAEAQAVLAAPSLPPVPPTARAALAARLAGEPPVEIGAHEGLLPWAQAGLIRPSDVIPRGEHAVLLEVAALWQETAPLSAVLRGEPVAPDAAACPPEWKPALRKVLTRGRVESWLARWKGRDLTPLRIWLCETLELPALVRYLAGAAEEAGTQAGEETAAALPWVTALWRAEPLEERLRLILRLAQEEWLAGQDRQATAFVAALLRQAEPALRELCSHVLSGRGPLPWLAGIAPHLLELLVPVLAPVPLVNALFTGPAFDGAEPLLDAVARRVQEAGARCPPDGYREEQLKRHAALAGRLAPLVSWESCRLDPDVRRPNGPDYPASCATEEIRDDVDT